MPAFAGIPCTDVVFMLRAVTCLYTGVPTIVVRGFRPLVVIDPGPYSLALARSRARIGLSRPLWIDGRWRSASPAMGSHAHSQESHSGRLGHSYVARGHSSSTPRCLNPEGAQHETDSSCANATRTSRRRPPGPPPPLAGSHPRSHRARGDRSRDRRRARAYERSGSGQESSSSRPRSRTREHPPPEPGWC